MTLDLTETIIAKSDQLNADDLIGGAITVTITNVKKIVGDQPVAIHYQGDNGKPYLPCKSMRRVLFQIWGKDGLKYIGKSMTLFRDPEVTWGGQKVGGIRISHMSELKSEVTLPLTAAKSSKKPYKVKPLEIVDNLLSLKDAADNASKLGMDSLQAWWGTLSTADQAKIKPHMGVYKEKAAAVVVEADIEVTEEGVEVDEKII